MNSKVKNIMIDVLLFIAILFVFLIGYFVLIAGPQRAYEKEDRQYVEAFEHAHNLSDLRLINRFSFDTVYYIVEDSENQKIYWFDKSLAKHGEHSPAPLDDLVHWAQVNQYSVKSYSYGVYEDQLVYVLITNQAEYFIEIGTFNVLLKIGG